MCWISGKQNIKIAEQNIPIFKIMKKTFDSNLVLSYFLDYLYTLNVLEKNEIEIEDRDDYIIVVRRALHSYSDRTQATIFHIFNTKKLCVFNKEKVLSIYEDNDNIIKVKGIIPKGSRYMENERGEYVSDKLILQEIEEL